MYDTHQPTYFMYSSRKCHVEAIKAAIATGFGDVMNENISFARKIGLGRHVGGDGDSRPGMRALALPAMSGLLSG
jgi:hypothetical protein